MFVTLIILSVFWSFFVFENNVAGDFSFLSNAELLQRFDVPRIWQERISEGLGHYALPILWNWPLDFLYGLLGRVGLTFARIEVLLFVLPFSIFGYYSIKYFLKYFGLKDQGVFAGSILYLLNTYVLLVVDGGQFSIALSYAFLPLVFVLFAKSLEGNLKQKLISGLSVTVLGFLDIRFLYILGILLFCHFVYSLLFESKNKATTLKNWVFQVAVVFIVFAFLNFYWILPSVISRAPSLPSGYGDVSQASNLSFATWKHAFMMQSPNWYENVFGKIGRLRSEFLLIPGLALLGIILNRKNKRAYYFAAIGLAGIFLVKGTNTPMPGVYPFLFENIPGFSLFRDPSKFFIFISLSYSFLIGSFADWAAKRYKIQTNKAKIFPISLITVLYFLFLISPVWSGKMTGTFAEPLYEDGFKSVWTELEKDNEFGRVLWMPSQPPLGYSSPIHPSLEASRIVGLRPFSTGVVGSYEIFNFLREASYMGELFDVYGIKYIVYPYYDTRKQDVKKDNDEYYHAFLDQLSELPWIESVKRMDNVALLKVKQNKDRFFVADNSWVVMGSDRIYNDFGRSESFRLSDNALIFTENGFGARKILYKKNLKILGYDLAGNIEGPDEDEFYYDFEEPLFLDKKLTSSPGENGWWKRDNTDFLWLRNFLETKYGTHYQEFTKGGGVSISEGNNELHVEAKDLEKHGDMLFARFLLSPKGGKISFYQGDRLIRTVKTKIDDPEVITRKLTGYKDIPDQIFEYGKSEFFTTQIGRLSTGNEAIRIITEGDINIVNFIALTSFDNFDKQNEQTRDYLYNENVFNWGQLTEDGKEGLFEGSSSATVNYRRISPTQYKVSINGLMKPSTLVFSETYDRYWKLDGSEPYAVYSLLNGFDIEKDGEYDLYYEPQKWVNIGFIVSLVSLAAITCFLYLKRH